MIEGLESALRAAAEEWRELAATPLQYAHLGDAQLFAAAIGALAVVLSIARAGLGHQRWPRAIVLPAVPVSLTRSWTAPIVHLPFALALAGLPFLAVAVADPFTALVRSEATYPGRRICLTIDASNSMSSPFRTDTLQTQSEVDAAFFTTVAAAERFVQMRVEGRYRDLLALVEFGSEAYVVTPFTNDYQNIMTSLSLIGDPQEFSRFPDHRTLIARAIDRSVALFRAFDFLDAAGNLLVIFSDGEDTLAAANGRSLDDIIQSAVDAGVPVYFIRTSYNRRLREHIPDDLWIDAVQQTGGKFFAASDERSLLAAIHEIDRVSAGTIRLREYSRARPRFTLFAGLAVACFASAAALRLGVARFSKFP